MGVRLNDVINGRNIIAPGSVVGKGDRVIQLGGFLLLALYGMFITVEKMV